MARTAEVGDETGSAARLVRLKERAAGLGASLRKRVAFDRLLARLVAITADRYSQVVTTVR